MRPRPRRQTSARRWLMACWVEMRAKGEGWIHLGRGSSAWRESAKARWVASSKA